MNEPARTWRQRAGEVEIAFAGKGAGADRERSARSMLAGVAGVAWLEQIHSATVLAARKGCAGRGDALLTRRPGLALVIATADCVPILLAGRSTAAAVHAGWRGLAGGIVAAAVERLEAPGECRAWIGPAIGACCYEVGEEVAARVAAASGAGVVRPGRRARPHLDLAAAAAAQLRLAGIREVHDLGICTRCDSQWWSYRRDGAAAGRNLAMIQIRSDSGA